MQMKNYRMQMKNYPMQMKNYPMQMKKIEYCNVSHAIDDEEYESERQATRDKNNPNVSLAVMS